MAAILNIHIENFRSIEKLDIDLSRITILTGANNSGKTSIIYALMALKNFVTNPNQSLDNLLVFGNTNLGGFKETVFAKNENSSIVLSYILKFSDINQGDFVIGYKIILGKKGVEIHVKCFAPYQFELKIQVALPYPLNKKEIYTINIEGALIDIEWNGAQVTSIKPSENKGLFNGGEKRPDSDMLTKVALAINMSFGFFTFVDYIPQNRTFTKPFFNTIPLSNNQYTEDEIATLLATDRELEAKVAMYIEKFIDKVFSVRPTPGTSNFYLQLRDKKTGFVTDIVNEGLGINQLVVMLAKILKPTVDSTNVGLICIDEPEVHMHPSYIDIFVEVLIDISIKGHKQFVLSSHSEHLVSAFLNKVAEKKLKAEDLKIHYLTKPNFKTEFEEQKVNEKGQIEGGLKSFYESELQLSKDFFKPNS